MAKKNKYTDADLSGKENIKFLKKCEYDSSALSLDPLLIYVIGEMEKQGIRLSEPNIAIAAHRIFPKDFSIFGWPGYPCTKRIDTGMLHLRYKDKLWVTGTCNQYIITNKGRRVIEETEAMLKGIIAKNKRRGRRSSGKTRKPEKLVAQIKKSNAYVKYANGDIDEITQFELYNLLQCTLDAPFNVIKENYESFCIFAGDAEDKNVIDFLGEIKPKVMETQHV